MNACSFFAKYDAFHSVKFVLSYSVKKNNERNLEGGSRFD
jgi:hypothetical protein